MPARIVGRDKQHVHTYDNQCQVLQANSTEEQQVYRIVGLPIGRGRHDGQHGSRSAQQVRSINHRTEIREYVVGQQVKQSSANAAQQIHPPQMPGREETQEQIAEPEEPEHVEQDVQEVGMQKHVRQYGPRLQGKVRQRGRHLEPLDKACRRQVEKAQSNAGQRHCQENGSVDVNQADMRVSAPEIILQVSYNSSHFLCYSFSNT